MDTVLGNKRKDLRNKVCLIIGICIAVFLIAVICGGVFYETNDDEGLNLIAVGGYGRDVSQYLVFINIVYSSFLKLLCSVVPYINWYVWLLLGFDLLGMIFVCVGVGRKLEIKNAVIFTFAMNLIFLNDIYNAVQYTKSAMWYGACGAVLVYCAIREKRLLSFEGVGGVLFFSLSVLVRSLCSYIAAVGLGAVIGLEVLISAVKNKRIKISKEQIKAVAMVAVIIVGFQLINKAAYSTPEWSHYFDIYDTRQELLDYGLPDYSSNRDKFNEIGVSQISYTMLEKWIFNDPEFFNLEKMKEIVAIKAVTPRYRVNAAVLGSMATSIADSFRRTVAPSIFIVLGLLTLGLKKWKAAGLWGILFLCIIAEYWHLCCVDRVVYRVVFGVWGIPAVILLAYLTLEYEWDKKSFTDAAFIIMSALTASALIWIAVVFVNAKHAVIDTRKSAAEEFVEEINLRDDGYYIGNTNAFYNLIIGSPYRLNKQYEGFYRNFGFAGGWEISTPVGDYYLKTRNMDNPIKALYEEPNVFYVDNTGTEMLVLRYLQEIYDPKITMTQVDEICGYKVFKYNGG